VNDPAVNDPVEHRLRDAFGAVAAEVEADPTSYRRASAGWRRRYRRRRLVLATLAAIVFVAADAVGLWALNQADPHTHVIFSDPRPGPEGTIPLNRVGQP
jgi:hypothetical protein